MFKVGSSTVNKLVLGGRPVDTYNGVSLEYDPGSLDSQVQAILAGTNGWVIDPSDVSTMWQDSAKTIPVTATSDPVGAIVTKWGNIQHTFVATGTTRPLFNGVAGIDYDGVDDELEDPLSTILTSRSQVFSVIKASVDVLAGAPLGFWGNATLTRPRYVYTVGSSGQVTFNARYTDGGTGNTVISANGLIVAGTPFTLESSVIYKNLTPSIELKKDGVVIASNAGSGSLTVNAAGANPGGMSVNLPRFNGRVGRIAMTQLLPTQMNANILRAWVNEAPL